MTACILRKVAALLLDIVAQVRSKAVRGESVGLSYLITLVDLWGWGNDCVGVAIVGVD